MSLRRNIVAELEELNRHIAEKEALLKSKGLSRKTALERALIRTHLLQCDKEKARLQSMLNDAKEETAEKTASN